MSRTVKKYMILTAVFMILLISLSMAGCSRKNTLNVLILGDSISEGAGVSDYSLKWYKFLSPYFEENYGTGLEITNTSMGGSASYAGYCRLMQQDEKADYDIIIICFGANDLEEDFDLYYESILWNITRKYPDTCVYSILESSEREYTPKMNTILNLADYYGVKVIDTIDAFNESGYAYEELCDDGTHPNDLGHQIYYEKARDVLETDFADGKYAGTAI